MNESAEVRERVRSVLQALTSTQPAALDEALEQIMDVVDPFRAAALEELERFRPTFIELAK